MLWGFLTQQSCIFSASIGSVKWFGSSQQSVAPAVVPCISQHTAMQIALLGILLAWLINTSDASGRVVQLITENPSPFVAADPNDPQYMVSLFSEDNPPSELPSAALMRHMTMTDASGQRYNCSIPESPSQFRSDVAAQKQQAVQLMGAPTRTPFELLDSLTGLCLYRQDGLWTYEVCHKKHVRQFRQGSRPALKDGVAVVKVTDSASLVDLMKAVEAGDMEHAMKELGHLMGGDAAADSAKGKEDFSCGQYSGDDLQIEAILEDASSSGHSLKYVSHVFAGGADCVLTGAPRTAEVRYTCSRDAKENVVLSVREFPSCNYVLVVSTPFLCKHPAFAPPAQDTRLISCLPIDEEGQAVIKELRRLAASPKAISDGQSHEEEDSTPKVSASAPAAAAVEVERESSKKLHKDASQAADASVVRTGRVSGRQVDPRQQQLDGEDRSGQDSAGRGRKQPQHDDEKGHDEL